MSKLTDFLHRLVDQVGASSLHDAVDELDKDTAPKDESVTEEKEDGSNAAE